MMADSSPPTVKQLDTDFRDYVVTGINPVLMSVVRNLLDVC